MHHSPYPTNQGMQRADWSAEAPSPELLVFPYRQWEAGVFLQTHQDPGG